MGELKKEYRCVLDLAHDIIGGKWKLRMFVSALLASLFCV